MTGHINLGCLGNDKGDYQKGNICMLPLLLKQTLLLLHHSIYYIEGKLKLNHKILCA